MRAALLGRGDWAKIRPVQACSQGGCAMASRRSSNSTDPNTQSGVRRRDLVLSGIALVVAAAMGGSASTLAHAQQTSPPPSAGSQPNILAIMADDIGWFNVSAYHRGMMGGHPQHRSHCARGCIAH